MSYADGPSLSSNVFFFQGTTSGFWTETGRLVRPVTSHKCGASLPPSTLCSPAATARAKHTFSRYSFHPNQWVHLTNLNLRCFMGGTLCTLSGCIFAAKQSWLFFELTFPIELSKPIVHLCKRLYRYIFVAWGVMFWFAMFTGSPVLEIWKWCFGPWLSKGHWNRLWWASGPYHSCSVCASVPEEERVSLLLQERWCTAAVSGLKKDYWLLFGTF